jgi:hypothetical protein
MYTARAIFETPTRDLNLRNKIRNTGWDMPRIRRWSPATYCGGTASNPGPVHAGFAVEKSGTGTGFPVSVILSMILTPFTSHCAIESDAGSYVTSADSYSEHSGFTSLPGDRGIFSHSLNANSWTALSNSYHHFTFMLPCKVIDFLLNNKPDALIIQIYSVIKLYMFRVSSLPIIGSFLLYIRHW